MAGSYRKSGSPPRLVGVTAEAGGSHWPVRPARLLISLLAGLLVLLLLVLGVVGWVGSERALYPEWKVEEHALGDYAFAAQTESVEFPSLDGTMLAGWFIPAGESGQPVVILLHGYGRSHAEVLPHADYLHRAGYNVLLFDFRGRGESGGGKVTLGAREPLDVRGAVDHVLTRTDVDATRIAVQGVSLGASSGILAMARDPRIAAAVFESPFDTMDGAVARSFEHFINLPPFPFAPVTVFIVEQRLDADADDVRPVDAIRRVGQRPVLIIEDLSDDLMPLDAGSRVYEAASGPKQLWQVEGAEHAAAYKAAPAEYERRVLAFYQMYLGGE